MKVIRKYAVLAASVVLALGIGHVMQSTTPAEHPALVLRALETPDSDVRLAAARQARESDLLPSINQRGVMPLAADVEGPVGGSSISGSVRAGDLPVIDLPGGFLLDAPEETAGPEYIQLGSRSNGDMRLGADVFSHPSITPESDAAACERQMMLAPGPVATISLAVDAPCDAHARVVVRHSGLAVTARIGAGGQLDLDLPAFAETAEVAVSFPDGGTISAWAVVPDLALYDRVGVQWQSPDSFQLHAFEFGAEFGTAGHVSATQPRDPGHAERATGGFLMLLGDSQVSRPLLAEVYTFPSARVLRSGTIAIEIEAMVTAEVCGRQILGETLQVSAGRPAILRDLALTMPGCEAEGQFIVLKNALDDLTIAAN